jgi:hypothetical protein
MTRLGAMDLRKGRRPSVSRGFRGFRRDRLAGATAGPSLVAERRILCVIVITIVPRPHMDGD